MFSSVVTDVGLKTSTTSHQSGKIEMNSDTAKEVYHYDFK
ncbi:polymorphic toxin type 25 domain-containing protein [Cedecea neteri]